MPAIKIDNTDYDTDTLSAEAKAQIEMLLASDGEIRRINNQLAIV